MRHFRSPQIFMVLIALAFGAAAAPATLAQKAKPKPKPKVVYYSVKSGTTIRVRLDQNIGSKTARVGDPIRSTTVDPIYSTSGVLLIPQGSTVTGRVDSVERAAKNGKPGTIGASFTSVTLPNQRQISISGMPVPVTDGSGKNTMDGEGTVSANKTSNRHLKFIGGGAAGGAIIGGIAGGGTGAVIGAGVGAVGGLVGKNLSKGKEVEVKSGAEFGVYLGRAISLPRYR